MFLQPIFIQVVFGELIIVRTYTENIIQNVVIEDSNDPLNDFSLTNFLNKFMYKNIKNKELSHIKRHCKKSNRNQSIVTFYIVLVNSKDFINLPENRVKPEDIFFYRVAN